MRQYIEQFISSLKNTGGKINPIYRRNFRELIKIIPMVGSWIDANTLGAIEDALLEDRLKNLDEACSRALSLDDAESLYAEIMNINALFFVILLTNIDQISIQNHQITSDIGRLLTIAESQQREFAPHKNFRFVTISGPSAVGKDCILDLIVHHSCKSSIGIETLTKFTTREKRLVDSKYYDFVSEERFDLLEQSGQLIFPYYKRGARYGFDRTNLFNSARHEQALFCVFTHFESLPSDRTFLKSQGIKHIAVLLQADKESLFIRSEARLLKPDDIKERKRSIERDFVYLKENKRHLQSCFDLIIDNSDSHSKWNSYNKVVKLAGLPELVLS